MNTIKGLGVAGGWPTKDAAPPTPRDLDKRIIESITDLLGDQNKGLNNAVERAKNVADRLFGEQPSEANNMEKDGGPQNDLGKLTTQVQIFQIFLEQLHTQLTRLDPL